MTGLCEGTVAIPSEWFSHSQSRASFTVQTRLRSSFDPPKTVGTVVVNPRSSMAFTDDIALVVPSTPVSPTQLFTVPIYGHATYSIAAYSVLCEVGQNLVIEGMALDTAVWLTEIRPLNLNGVEEVGVVGIIRNPEGVSEMVRTEPELLFSLEIRVLASAIEGGTEPVNCTTVYLSNILNEKIQPRGEVTPTPALSLGATTEPGLGQVRIAQTLPRGLFSFAEQSQVANTAVLNGESVLVRLTHLVALSSGLLVNITSVECSTDSSAFQLSPHCNQVYLDGSESAGISGDTITTTYMNHTSSVQLRVWYPRLPVSAEISPSVLRPIEGWLTVDGEGQCSQEYQQAYLTVSAEFAHSDSSQSFTVSILPLLTGLINSSDPSVTTVSSDASVVTAHSEGRSVISAGSLFTPVHVTVSNDSVLVSSLEVTLFSGLSLNLPSPPYPQLSIQTLSVNLDQTFPNVTSPVFLSLLLTLADGRTMSLEESEVSVDSLAADIIDVSGGVLSLRGMGSGDLIQASLISPCTGLSIVTGNGSAVVNTPNPLRVEISQSSTRLTYQDNTATVGGIPTSITASVTLVFPGDIIRDATNDPQISYTFLLGSDLVTLVEMSSRLMIVPLDPTRSATGDVAIAVRYRDLISSNLSLHLVTYQGIQLYSTPFPSYPGSHLVNKSTLFQVESTGLYQQVALELQALLSDSSSITVTRSSLAFYQTTSPSVTISGNVVTATAPGVFQIQGQFGSNVSSIQLVVSETPVHITALQNFSIENVAGTFTGTLGTRAAVNLDVAFSDTTFFPGFIPTATNLFHQVLSLTIDTPSVVSINPLTGLLSLQNNHHSQVRVTASTSGPTQLQSQLAFFCNLQPALGDADLGGLEGAPIPPLTSGDTASVPLRVNTGTQFLRTAMLTLSYSTATLRITSLTQDSSWSGTLQYTDNPSVGVLTITASSAGGIAGLIRLATLEITALSSGVGSIGGVVIQLTDIEGSAIGNGRLRAFVAGDVTVMIPSSRSRRDVDKTHLRLRRNTQCSPPFPCEVCPNSREMGDVNGDCVFDDADVQFLLQYHAEGLFGFGLDSGSALTSSLIAAQEQQLDSDLNTALDPQDAYFLHEVLNGLLNFLISVTIQPIQDSATCQLALNATLLGRGDTVPDVARTMVFFDIALPFDPTFISQRLLDESVFPVGTLVPTADKGLALPGVIIQASEIESGVFAVLLETNLTLSDIGVSIVQSTSQDTLTTSQVRTRAMFGHPDPPFSNPSPLAVPLPAFSDVVSLLASEGYSSFISFNNTMSTHACITPPPPPLIAQPLVRATVPENLTVGSEVVSISAESQSDRAVVYSIPNPDAPFSVGTADGVIRTVQLLDYESTNFFRLRVLATDPATGFSSSVTAEISVTDINDNAPVFDALQPDISLPANTPVGAIVAMLNAEDADEGLNALVFYTTQGSGFAVDFNTGIVTLEQRLDFDTQDMHLVTVTATDMGTPFLSSSVTLNVTVLPPDPTVLQFSTPVHNISVEENSPEGLELLQFSAAPVNQSEEAVFEIAYSLQSSSGLPFLVNTSSGMLLVDGVIDRELTESYELSVTAVALNSNRAIAALAVVFITVSDVNDNAPVFDESEYTVSTLEEMPPGTFSFTVRAQDADLGVNASLRYSLLQPLNALAINATSGLLSNVLPLDYESEPVIFTTVVATDLGVPPLITDVNVTVLVMDINDNPPVLVVTPEIVRVNESLEVATVLAVALTSDLDSPQVNGITTLTLFLAESGLPSSEFEISSATGEISSSVSLDFENVQQYSLIVTATDGGSPRMSSSQNFTVFVSDVNDNPPVFEQEAYNITLSESLQVPAVILVLTASDADSGSNADVEFRLVSVEPPHNLFMLSLNGELQVSSSLDFDLTQAYDLVVMVENTVPGAAPDTATVHIDVTAVNEFPPVFSQDIYEASVREELQGADVIQVMVNDSDLNDGVFLSVDDPNFRVGSDGLVMTAVALDRERISQFNITVIAVDDGVPAMTATALVRVEVLDINDNSPVFDPFRNISILESTPVGTVLETFSATDADDGSNGMISSILLITPTVDFMLTSDGELVVANLLNSSNTQTYLLTIQAQDGGEIPLSTTTVIAIDVEASPAPVFEQSTYTTSVLENSPPGTFLVQVRAISHNPQATVTAYRLITNALPQLFAVDAASGRVTATAPLDREQRDVYLLEVEVEARFNSSSLTARTEVNITVLDVNDNPPQFVNPPLFLSLNENVGVGVIVTTFEARDVDLGDNAIINYAIISGNNELELAIDGSGSVRTTVSLIDRVGQYNLTIEASNPGLLSDTAQVVVEIGPVNNFAPVFDMTEYVATVPEDTDVGTVITSASATDSDEGSAGEVSYRIMPNNNQFSIDSASGNVTLEGPLDFEIVTRYSITILAIDGGLPSLSSTVALNVIVTDVNDNQPVFNQSLYLGSLNENLAAGQAILTVVVEDADSPPNSISLFEIVPSPFSSFFQITPSGILQNSLPLDRETLSSALLMISVSNSGSGVTFTATTMALVTVNDLNDNPPIFSESQYSRVLQAPVPANFSVLTVQVSDADSLDVNTRVQFSVQDPTNMFAINTLSGMIQTVTDILNEANFTFIVTASDPESLSLSSQALVSVTILAPGDLTAGRERDFVFSTDQGVSLLGTPSELVTDSYAQLFGFAVGRDSRQRRAISASLSSLSSNLSILPRVLDPASVKAVIVSREVWPDDPRVILTTQARDNTHNVHVVTSVSAQITHPSQGNARGSCTTRSSDGTCTMRISLPATWFGTTQSATVQFGLSLASLQDLGSVELQQLPVFDAGTDVYCYLEMPLRTLFVGNAFSVPVHGRTGSKGVGSYTVTVRGSTTASLVDLTYDRIIWSAQVQAGSGGSMTITAVRSDQMTIPSAEDTVLFTIQALVSQSSGLDFLTTSAITADVVELSDFDRLRLLPLPGMTSVQAFALSRNGITREGAVYVARDAVVGILPYVNSAELINTALLSGNPVTENITILSVHRSGVTAVSNTLPSACSSSDPSVVAIASNCASLTLTTSQRSPSMSISLSITHNGQSASFPVLVWVPLMPVRLMAADTVLEVSPSVLDATFNCTALRQSSVITAFVNFTNTLDPVQNNIDVTSLISMSLSSSEPGVVRIDGNVVHGREVGNTTLTAVSHIPGLTFTEVRVSVVDDVVGVVGLDVRVHTRLATIGPQGVSRLNANQLLVTTEQEFDFEGTVGTAVATAVFADGSRLLLDESRVSFSSLAPNVVGVSGSTVTALGSGRGELVEAVWNSPTECLSEPVARGVATVSVNIPRPSIVNVILSSSVLTAPGSTASSIGVSTSSTVRVTAIYSDGRTQDLTTDNRTMYSIPTNINLMAIGNAVTINSNSNATTDGTFTISVSFTQFQGLTQNTSFTVVSMTDISLRANPFPTYPGSNLRNVTRLAQLATSNPLERQQAILLATAVLSNGNFRDVSAHTDLMFRVSADRGFLGSNVMITTGNILRFADATAFGTLTIRATLREVTSSRSLVLDIPAEAEDVSGIRILPFPDGNTLRGVVDVTQRQVVIDVTFGDGKQYVNLFQDTMLPGIVRFEAFPASAVTIGENSGVSTLRGNSPSLATIRVISLGSTVTAELNFACNLDPGVGDVDLGSQTGIPVPPLTTLSQISVPVSVNSGTAILDSIELDIVFDPNIIQAVSAVPGNDWPSTGQFQFTNNDPVNIITVGGTLVGSTSVGGTSLHLATIQFQTVGAGLTNISGIVHTLAERPSPGSTAENIGIVPRDFIAGSIQAEVRTSRRRRSDTHAPVHSERFRRQSTNTCPSPPCSNCPLQRETGDVDGNCIFDVRDVSFLQLHYLTTINTGVEPTLPDDRRQFLDSDLNGRVDANDVVFMLRVNFRLLRFLSQVLVFPVNSSTDGCELVVNTTLLNRGDTPAENTSTSLIFDVAVESPNFQAMFDASNFTTGTVLPVRKGSGLYGGLVLAEYLGNGVYGIRAESALGQVRFGLSPIQVTFDAEGNTFAARVAAMFSSDLPRYGMLDASIPLREHTVNISTQLGYSPLLLVNSTLSTQECLLLQSPLIFRNTPYTASVSELASTGDVVLRVLATSNRPSLSTIYALSDVSDTFPLRLNTTTGVLSVSAPLDFENVSSYSFQVMAIEVTVDNEILTASASVVVTVTNENDLEPVITPLSTTLVLASLPAGEQVLQVSASDPDNLESDSLNYSITTASTPALFSIGRRTGTISIAGSLLDSANTVVNFTVTVSDSLFSTSAEVTIDIFLPSFSQQTYEVDVSEFAAVGTSVTDLTLINQRGQAFTFESQDVGFAVNEAGEVSLNTTLDFETQRSYEVTVIANSSIIEVTAVMIVNVTDENDNAPEFTEGDYNITIPANTDVGSFLIRLVATDADSPGPNSDIAYSLLPNSLPDYFGISRDTGDVTLVRSLFSGPSIVILNVTATDNGSPSLSGSATLTVVVDSTGIPEFPVPPIVLSSGGVLVQSGPIRQSQLNTSGIVFQQAFTKLSGSLSGQLSALFTASNVGASVGVSTSTQVAFDAAAHLLHPSSIVYQEDRDLRVAFQVRDSNYLTRVSETSVEVEAILVGMSSTARSVQCSPHLTFGTCVSTLSLPEDWFRTPANVLLQPLLNREALPTTTLLTLQPSPALLTTITNNILVECPARDIVSGESFLLHVYGYSTFSISGFSVVVQTTSPLTVTSLHIDNTQWSVQTANGTGRFVVSAILSSPAEADGPSDGSGTLLFSLQVFTAPRLSSAVEASVTAQVQSLSNAVEGSTVLGTSGNTSGPAQFLSRDGQGLTGTIYVVPNSVLAVYPYIQQTELVNTAVLTGSLVSVPVQVFVGYTSGDVLAYSEDNVNCTSSAPRVVNPDSSCYAVVFSGEETAGSSLVSIMYSVGTARGTLPLRVYFPALPLVYTITDSILNRIQYSNSCMAYQQATISVHTDFIASSEFTISNVAVTNLVSPLLNVSDGSVLSVSGDNVQGLSPGNGSVCAVLNSISLGCTLVTVSSEPVEISGLAGSVLIDISIMASGRVVNANSTIVATIQPRSQFRFEQEQGTVLVAVQFTDGVISVVDSAEVSISASNTSVYSVRGNAVVSTGSGEAVGEFVWQPLAGQCNLNIVDFFLVTSSLPSPIAILTSLPPSPELHMLTTPSDPTSLVGVPTSLALTVTALFEGGRRLDVTRDPRVTFEPSSDTLRLDDGRVVVAETTPGLVQLTVQYRDSEVVLNTTLDIEVLVSTGVIVLAHPYPTYPGSEEVNVTTLNPIEDTGVWERVVLEILLLLSNGTVVEVTGLTEASLDVVPIIGAPNVQVDDSAILSVTGGSGIIRIVGRLSSHTGDLIFTIDTVPVRVTAARVLPLPSNTLRGITGTPSHQLAVDLTLSDTTQLLSYPTNPAFAGFLLPGLISYNTSSPDFSVDTTGVLTPITNSGDSVEVDVTVGSDSITSSASFVVNLDPGVGDVDIGSRTGRAVSPARVGEEVSLPVVVNAGGRNLGSLDVLLVYDEAVLAPVEVTTGPDFGAGLHEASLNDPLGEIRFGGALSADVSGPMLHLFNVRIRFIGPTSSAGSHLSGSVLTFAERNLAGTLIGLPTPRPVVAGNITFTVAGSTKRSAHLFSHASGLSHTRLRRQAECITPPCACSGQLLGDADGNCEFDIRDVSFTLLFLTQELLNSPSGGLQITPAQRQQLDPNQDETIDSSDAFFLLRALFRLIHFLERVSVTPVQDPSSGCLFTVEVELGSAQNLALGEVEVMVDIGFQDALSTDDFENSLFVSGELLTADKGPLLNGRVILTQQVEGGLFRAEVNASFVSSNVGVSVILATFDAQNATSSSRSVQFFGRPPLLYPFPLHLNLAVRATQVLVAASSGYSPFITTSNTIPTSQCSDLPLLGPDLDVVFLSPHLAELNWTLLNERSGLNITSALSLITFTCQVDQTRVVLNQTCVGPEDVEVNNHTSHVLVTTPFTAYYLQINAPSTSTDVVGVVSPEAPPTEVGMPDFVIRTDRLDFQWSLPASPNGVITHYTLYVNSMAVFNGTGLSYSLPTQELQVPLTFFLDAHNSAGSSSSSVGSVSTLVSTQAPSVPGVSLAVEEAIIISVASTAFLIILLLLIMCAGMLWKRWTIKAKKLPSFLATNFDAENTGVVSYSLNHLHVSGHLLMCC